jgi:hypothetical protein
MEQIRLTLTVPDGTRSALEQEAAETSRSKANLVGLLLVDYLRLSNYDIEKVGA